MDGWEEYKSPNTATNQNAGASGGYYRNENQFANRDNMMPTNYYECFTEPASVVTLKKVLKIFRICFIVAFVLSVIGCFALVGLSSQTIELHNYGSGYLDDPVREFDVLRFFVLSLVSVVVLAIVYLIFEMVCAVINCVINNTHNASICAKLAAYNTQNQMNDASKSN